MVMAELWVVDSNCFIHIGSMAPDTFVKNISNALNNLQTGLHVTPGVHDEVRTVRFQKWKGQPNLLEKIQSLLITTTVENSQISGLANLIGEKAAPQDVSSDEMGQTLLIDFNSMANHFHEVLMMVGPIILESFGPEMASVMIQSFEQISTPFSLIIKVSPISHSDSSESNNCTIVQFPSPPEVAQT